MWGLFIRQGELAAKAWTEKEATSVASLLRTLKETSRYHASSFNADEIRVLRKMLQWPAQHRFPGIVLCTVCDLQQLKFSLSIQVLDLVSSMALHQDGAAHLAKSEVWKELEAVLLDSLKDVQNVPNQMLALRTLANCFNYKVISLKLFKHLDADTRLGK